MLTIMAGVVIAHLMGTPAAGTEVTRELPQQISARLSKDYPGWSFVSKADKDKNVCKGGGGRCWITGDYDGNGQVDYAVMIKEPTAKGSRTLIIAILAHKEGLKSHLVTPHVDPTEEFMSTVPKGITDENYETGGTFTTENESIMLASEKGNLTYVYLNRGFIRIISGD